MKATDILLHFLLSPGEDQTVTLSCNYSYTVSMNNLQWYCQYPNSRPQFIVLVTEYEQNQTADSDPRLSAHVHKSVKRVDLLISSAAVSDSALYYCALQPTVTGKHHSLYKNLWRCEETSLRVHVEM
uniref:Ig-like domain-containing protein n=1 Tax=Electrophorus electricus TaxID=8005 RepID=A0A4W4EZJ9_ELEEL